MKLLAKTFLLFGFLLFIISCSKEGESFIGKWKHVKNPNATIEIIANGENFLVIANGKENPATYNKGNLEIRTNQLGFEILQISYIEKDDKLIVNAVSGPQEYVRIDSAIENLEPEEPAFIPSEQLKINNDSVFREWREITSSYHKRNQISLELLNVSGTKSKKLEDLIALANKSDQFRNYDQIILDKTLFYSYFELQGQIGSELSKVLMSIDHYSNRSLREIISRLEEIESTIVKQRTSYNSEAKSYNLLIEKENEEFIKNSPRYAKKYLIEFAASEPIPIVEY